jgi:hypothetical protein
MIQIIKLQNGENLIANVSLENGQYILEEPMEFDVDHRSSNSTGSLIMKHWLPVQLLKKNEVIIKTRDVLSVLEPDEEFSEYYLHTVERIKKLLDAKNSVKVMSEEEMKQVLEALLDDSDEDKVLH